MGTGGQGRARVGQGPLRPVDGPDARHSVLEAVSPEAGHVIVHYLHLAATESRVLKEMLFGGCFDFPWEGRIPPWVQGLRGH